MTAYGDVAFARFQAWADEMNGGEPVTLSDMARRTGRSVATFSAARARGTVGAPHVIAYARAVGASPVETLRTCLDWPFLVDDPAPSTREWLSQIPHSALLAECARRLGASGASWEMPSGGTTVTWWVEAILPRERTAAARAALGMTEQAYANKKNRGTFTLEELRTLAGIDGHSLRMALVAQGGLTWQEVGLDGQYRSTLLQEITPLDLLDYVEASTGQMRRALRAAES